MRSYLEYKSHIMDFTLTTVPIVNIYVMTYQQFEALSARQQHRELLLNGVCIANRKTEHTEALLFQLNGFYMEVFFDLEGDEVLYSRSFDNTDDLYPYLSHINVNDALRD